MIAGVVEKKAADVVGHNGGKVNVVVDLIPPHDSTDDSGEQCLTTDAVLSADELRGQIQAHVKAYRRGKRFIKASQDRHKPGMNAARDALADLLPAYHEASGDWFRDTRGHAMIRSGATRHKVEHTLFQAGSESADAALVDPCGEIGIIWNKISSLPDIHPRYIFLTHGHHDHCSGVSEARKYFNRAIELRHWARLDEGAEPS